MENLAWWLYLCSVFGGVYIIALATFIVCLSIFMIVSTRGSRGREKTIDTLNKTLYKNTLKAEKLSTEEIGIGSRYVQFIQHTQSLYTISKLYCYKDSSQMLSGLIIWN